MTLSDAVALLAQWPAVRFGSLYPLVAEADRPALKAAFVRMGPPGAAPVAAQDDHQPLREISGVARTAGYTGDVCGQCGSSRMTRSGVCLKCEDCGDTSGGCS